MTAIFASNPGKPIMQPPAVHIPVNHLLDIRPKKSISLLETIFINLFKCFQIVLNAPIVCRILRVAGPVSRTCAGHGASFKPIETIRHRINSDTDFADIEHMFYCAKAWTHRIVMRVCLMSLNLTGSGVIRYLNEGTNVLLWRQMTLEKSLSEKQKQLLKFLSDFNATRGFPPTIREICSHFGLKSLNTAHVQLRILENKATFRSIRAKAGESPCREA